MSRVGRKPIAIMSGATCSIDGQDIHVRGPKGNASLRLPHGFSAIINAEKLSIVPSEGASPKNWGTQRSLLAQKIKGVVEGFCQKVEFEGVGYRAASVVEGVLTMKVGFSHETIYVIPEGVTIVIEKPVLISISGVDAQKVGQAVADLRAFRPPSAYNARGIKRLNEVVLRKEGKKK